MAAPEYVPTKPVPSVRSYESPPRRPQGWWAVRPGDLAGDGQPSGELLGAPGPDQGYAYRLVRQFAGKVFTADGEQDDDVVAGVLAVAMKRSALFGRAPVVHDLTVGFAVWGYLNDRPPAELVAIRRKMFEECANPHHYAELRAIADAVPEETLRKSHTEVLEAHERAWRSLLDLPG
jgi:hypothetical protein